jgi:hypothetical protein
MRCEFAKKEFDVKRIAIGVTCALVAVLAVASPGSAAKPESDLALQELIEILRQKELIDDDQYMDLAQKAAAEEAKQKKSWTERFSFWGDMRGRWESFAYNDDPFAPAEPNRNRLRYRFRLNGKVDINDYFDVAFRIASGVDDDRSTNQTLGSSLDFDSDPIRLDKVYISYMPFGASDTPGVGGDLELEFGKVGNPYVWKVGKDFMLWDHDINPEGLHVKMDSEVYDGLDVFASTGYYIIDENSSAPDPYMVAAQLGSQLEFADGLEVGGRASLFHFGDLNQAFLLRGASSAFSPSITSGGGNILDGLTGSAAGGSMNVIETTAYFKARCGCLEDWPLTFYGSYSNNLDASPGALAGAAIGPFTVTTAGAGADPMAWGAGMEVGDKKKWLKMGFGFWHVEANAFPSMFTDSDLFDGFTNREGWAVYTSRQLLKNVDLNFTAFISDPIKTGAPYTGQTTVPPPTGGSVAESDRIRTQLDLVVKF